MPQKSRPISLNLLPQDPFFDTVPGKLLRWGSTIGRYLVIFTELVVLVSFAARFKLDRDLTDLNSSITQKVALIEGYGPLENEVRTIQGKTEFLAQQGTTASSLETLDMISSVIPADVALTSIQFRSQGVIFAGNSLSSTSLAQMIIALQQNPLVTSVSVDQVRTAENEVGFEFSIRIQTGAITQ